LISPLSAAPGQQSTVKTNTPAAPDYSKLAIVVQKSRIALRFENDGTETRDVSGEIRVQSEAGVQEWGILKFAYNNDLESPRMDYVRVHKPDGAIVETPQANVQDITSQLSEAAPVFSDLHELHVAVKGLGVGDLLEYGFSASPRRALVAGQFWAAYDFEKKSVILDEELEVNVPNGRELKLRSAGVTPQIRIEGNRKIYAWKNSQLNSENGKSDSPRIPPAPEVLLSTFQTWDDVAKWWGDLEKERAVVTPDVRAKAEELTRGLTSPDAKARAIYDYVAIHFRYIGVSLGIGRYQPHSASEVLGNEYGDCKDKHTLLTALLAAEGIKSSSALVNAAREIDPEVPSPAQFDHVVTVLPAGGPDGKDAWLDTTTQLAPFGFLTFNLRGRKALLIHDGVTSHLVDIPNASPIPSFGRFEIDATLGDDGVLLGKVVRVFRGDEELGLRLAFEQTAKAEWKDLAHRISQLDGFAGEVSDVQVDPPEATKDPFRFSYTYTRKDYPDWSNHRISAPLGAVGLAELGEQRRTQPVFLGIPAEFTAIARVRLPQGYVPELPENDNQVSDFYEFHSKYSFHDGVFVAEVQGAILKPEMPLAATGLYGKMQKAISDETSNYILLTNSTEAENRPKPPENPDALNLTIQASEDFGMHDLDGAKSLVDQALKIDGHFGAAWSLLGRIHMIRGERDEGIAAFQKSIQCDPQYRENYNLLVHAYTESGQTNEAIQTWQNFLKIYPKDEPARTQVARMLLQQKRYGEAVSEYEILSSGENPQVSLLLSLAAAYEGVGNSEKEMATYEKAGRLATDPGTLNDVAFALAEHRVNLADAETFALNAVHSLEADSADVTLTGLKDADLKRMIDLANFWDTLGWAYFQDEKMDRAEKYLEASWNLNQVGSVGDHLADLYDKQGKKALASHLHAMAGFLGGSGQIRNYRYNPSSPAPGDELSEMRRKNLGKLAAPSGSAEFFLLIVKGGEVEDVKFASGKETLRPQAKTIAALKFKAPLPDGGEEKLLRRGVTVCTTLGCDFTLFTLDTVNSVN
jgi:tetratricopeptide (TPR) repeat protein